MVTKKGGSTGGAGSLEKRKGPGQEDGDLRMILPLILAVVTHACVHSNTIQRGPTVQDFAHHQPFLKHPGFRANQHPCFDCFPWARHQANGFLHVCSLNTQIKHAIGSSFLSLHMRKGKHREVNNLPKATQQWQILESPPGLSGIPLSVLSALCCRPRQRAETAAAVERGDWHGFPWISEKEAPCPIPRAEHGHGLGSAAVSTLAGV